MDLGAGQGRGGVAADAPVVIGLAVRQPPDAGVVGRFGTARAHGLGLAAQGRIDLALDDPLCPGRPVAGQVLLGRAPHDGGRQDHPVGGGLIEVGQLEQGLVDDEVRRHSPGREVGLHPGGFLIEGRREGGDARQIGLGVLGRLDRMLGVEEVGQALVRPGQLRDRIGRGAEAAAAIGETLAHDLGVAEEGQGVVIDALGFGQGAAVDGLELVHLRPEHRPVGIDLGLGPVIEAGLHGRHRALVHAQPGQGLGRLQQEGLDDPVHQGRQGGGGRGGRLRQGLATGGETRAGGDGEHKTAAIDHHGGRLPWHETAEDAARRRMASYGCVNRRGVPASRVRRGS